MKEVQIPSNGNSLSAQVFEAKGADRVLIIASATGVKQGYYQKFAEHMALQGINVVTFDYTGIGNSLKGPIKKLAHGAQDWGRYDLEAVINYVIQNHPNSKITLLGHSIGGQLIGLAPSSVKVHKIVLVAAQSGYWKLWSGKGRRRLWFNWHVLIPLLSHMFGYLPSKRITGMENLPKNVALQWARWGRSPEYLLSEIGAATTAYARIKAEVTAVSIEDDELATKKAVAWMTGQYSGAQMKSVHLVPADFKTSRIGHFGLFKEKFKDSLWSLMQQEIA